MGENDSVDKLLRIWLGLPESIHPKVIQYMKDDIGQFDINQPVMRGLIKMEDGSDMPFFCLLSGIIMPCHVHGNHQLCILLTTFRREGEWRSTVTEERRPDFSVARSLPTPVEAIQAMLAGNPITDPDIGKLVGRLGDHDDAGGVN